jgi:hypothetical protein
MLLARDSTNTFLLVESARHAVRHDDPIALDTALLRLERRTGVWPEAAQAQLRRVQAARARRADAGAELTFLAATLEPLSSYARDREAIALSADRPDLVSTRFLLLPAPLARPPAPDLELRYDVAVVDAPAGTWLDVRPVWSDNAAPARVGLLAARSLFLAGDPDTGQRFAVPASSAQSEAHAGLALLDFDHDFDIDIAVAGSGGVRLLRLDTGGRFNDVADDALPATAHSRAYTAIWTADTDLDGDLDLVLSPRDATPFVLRNLGDGTFAEQHIFDADVTGAHAFIWGDLDDDGVPDAALLDTAGRLHVFRNARQDQPRFARRDVPAELGAARAVALGDLDSDGTFELVVLRSDGALVRAWLDAGSWQTREAARWRELPADSNAEAAPARLIIADLDNNGALDVIASAAGHTRTWLGDSTYALIPHLTLPVTVTAAADLEGAGWIELLGVDLAGRPVRLSARRTRAYYALTIGPRAADQPGDRRVNTFGIDGVAEVRAGPLYQKQIIAAPVVHFGIGEATGVNVARIIWPNGTAQAEFDLLATQGGQPIVALQRLKGSCPWLFGFAGDGMRFITDVIWRTALGLRINAYGSSSVIHSEDRVKIRGDQLAPRDGFYDLSITGELWESHFFDHVALMVVDHPADTEIFVDERFTLPPPPLRVHATAALRPIVSARDDRGRDVTALVTARDERYVDTFELGDYQGVAREHFIEVELGATAQMEGPLILVGHGWVYPTDGSINFALGQQTRAAAHGIRVEVPDNRGGWSVLHTDLGMPAGKTKTVIIDLAGAFHAGTARRVRLRTSMEIYWDHIAWTQARPDTELRITRVLPDTAELRYRGFSRTRQDGRRAPELPEYVVAGTAPIWRDLVGHYTRFGDVRPLLVDTDDRYVIMNAGDELRLRFAAPPPAPPGWVRDYVFVGDGWVKDGDYNNGFSGTLQPLPYHGLTDYSQPPGRLAEEPAVRQNPNDWRTYHTRYITPTRFHHALSRY